MKVLKVCDICEKPIKNFKDYRELSLIKRKDWDCIVSTVWEHDLCMTCALSIESEVRRRITINARRNNRGNISGN